MILFVQKIISELSLIGVQYEKKIGLAAALFSSFVMVGCANTDIIAEAYILRHKPKKLEAISYGTIVSVRDVKIQTDNQGVIGTVGGGVLGGIAGSAIGGGRGQAIATASTVGAIAGAMASNTIEERRVKFLH